jgi:hypothetical protein
VNRKKVYIYKYKNKVRNRSSDLIVHIRAQKGARTGHKTDLIVHIRAQKRS